MEARAVLVPEALVEMMCRDLDGWNEIAKEVIEMLWREESAKARYR